MIGRPPLETISDLRHGGPGIAQRVFAIEAQIGNVRGALAQAIRQVAAETSMPVNTVKVYARRYATSDATGVRDMIRSRHATMSGASTLNSLLFGFPEDVQHALDALPLGPAFKLLKEHVKHPGHCPGWVVDCVRTRSETGEHLMERLEKAAAALNH